MAKLTKEQIDEIKRLRLPCDHCGGRPSLKILADQFGVSMAEISRAANDLVRGKSPSEAKGKPNVWGLIK